MAETQVIPDFVRDAGEIYPEVREEYSALARLARVLLAERQSNKLRYTVQLQCGIAWQHYNAIILLLANRFIAQALVLDRTLFELVVGIVYLIKNPNSLQDFLDHGKLVFYESARASGLPAKELAPIEQECESIGPRFPRGKTILPWHRSGIKKLANEVGLSKAYEAFYPDASGAVHADATMTLSFGSRGWRQSLRRLVSEKQGASVRYGSFLGTATLFLFANEALDLGNNKEASAVFRLMGERHKDLTKPN